METKVKILNPDNTSDLKLLSEFINQAGNSLNSFRYYNKRPIEIIKNHLYTILLIKNNLPIAYGHLDNENNTIWLGIAVIEEETGNGWGKIIMKNLLDEAEIKNYFNINLSVDKNNIAAISLYKKFGFKVIEDLSENIYFMKYNQKSESER